MVKAEVFADGVSIWADELVPMSVRPHESAKIALHYPVPEKGRCYLKITYLAAEDMACAASATSFCTSDRKPSFVEMGQELGFDEILLENEDGRNQTVVSFMDDKQASRKADANAYNRNLTVTDTETKVMVSGCDFIYTYDKLRGRWEQLTVNGRDIFWAPMEVNVWRAPTDNDAGISHLWRRAYYHQAYTRTYSTEISREEGSIILHSRLGLLAAPVQKMMDMDAFWRIDESGKIGMKMNVKKNPEFPPLPRFGLRLFLTKEFEKVTYFGMGPYESYIDKHRASYHGLFTESVENLTEDYIKPQENGSHYDCDFVKLQTETVVADTAETDIAETDTAFTCFADKTFSFNASVYTREELTVKKHNYELEEAKGVVLCLDYVQNGIGSNSCGPQLLEKYRFDEKEFTFEMNLLPAVNNE